MQVVLVEDRGWERLRPLTWLRPAGDLFIGAWSVRERWREDAGIDPLLWCRREVAALAPWRSDRPPEGSGFRLWVRDRLLPDPAWAREAASGKGAAAWSREGALVAVRTDRPIPNRAAPTDESFWTELAGDTPAAPLERGRLVVELPDLVSETARLLDADLEGIVSKRGAARRIGDGAVYAPERIAIGEGCRIDHGAVLDGRDGPIVLGAGTAVFPHTWIRGPFGCREEGLLLGGRIGGGSYLGPCCRVRGEVEASTFHGFVNKAHDGFVGHSYLGEWVNLGALTTTSDLKNNYGPVRLEAYGRLIDSGQSKIGSFVGDHAKTRIGALLNSGSIIGVAANLFGEVSVFPRSIPDFVWGVGEAAREYEWDRCLRMVETVLTRRGQTCDDPLRDALRVIFEQSFDERRRFLRPSG